MEDGDQNVYQAYLSVVVSLNSVLYFMTDRFFILKNTDFGLRILWGKWMFSSSDLLLLIFLFACFLQRHSSLHIVEVHPTNW